MRLFCLIWYSAIVCRGLLDTLFVENLGKFEANSYTSFVENLGKFEVNSGKCQVNDSFFLHFNGVHFQSRKILITYLSEQSDKE